MSRRNKNKRIQALKKELETLTLQMQFFCLDPQFQIYNKICESRLSKEGKHFDLWKLAVLATYGEYWIENDYIEFDLGKILEEFAKEKKKLLKHIVETPNAAKIDQLWYIFFASGDANMMLYIIRAAGNPRTKRDLQETIIDMYVSFSDEYKKKIDKILEDPRFISSHEIGPDRINQTIKSFQIVENLIKEEQEKTAGLDDKDVKSLLEQKELKKIILQ